MSTLVASGWWQSHNAVDVRMSTEYLNCSAALLSCRLEEGFYEGLLHLPNAFEYIRMMRGDYELVSEAIVVFLRGSHEELEATGLWLLVVNDFIDLFCGWTRHFAPMTRVLSGIENTIDGVTVDRDPAIDTILDRVLCSKVPFDSSILLFSYMFRAWLEDNECPESRATLLDFFLRVLCGGGSLPLYRNPEILAAAFDKQSLRAHWAQARDLINSTCDEAYVKTLLYWVVGDG